MNSRNEREINAWIPDYDRRKWGCVEHHKQLGEEVQISAADIAASETVQKRMTFDIGAITTCCLVIIGISYLVASYTVTSKPGLTECRDFCEHEVAWLNDTSKDYSQIYNLPPREVHEGPLVEVNSIYSEDVSSDIFGTIHHGRHISRSIGFSRAGQSSQYSDTYLAENFRIGTHKGKWIVMVISGFDSKNTAYEKKRQYGLGQDMKILYKELSNQSNTELWFVRLDHIGFGSRFWPTSSFPRGCYSYLDESQDNIVPCMDRIIYAGGKIDTLGSHFWKPYIWMQQLAGHNVHMNNTGTFKSSIEAKLPMVLIIDPQSRGYHVTQTSDFSPLKTLLAYQHLKRSVGEVFSFKIRKELQAKSMWNHAFRPHFMEDSKMKIKLAVKQLGGIFDKSAETAIQQISTAKKPSELFSDEGFVIERSAYEAGFDYELTELKLGSIK